jgi:DNA end-binding protein Ku
MAHTIWKGAIQFGLVVLPVRTYAATDTVTNPPVHLLHRGCGSRIQQQLWCPVDQVKIDRSDTERGFEVAPERFVVLSDAEVDSLPVAAKHVITIEQFIRDSEVREATRFPRDTYFVGPESLGARSFALLRNTLGRRKLAGIGRVALRDREHVAVLEAFGPVLLLTTLAWPDEIRRPAEIGLPADGVPATAQERELADQLVAMMTRPFDRAAIPEQYRAALTALINAKADGLELVTPPQPQSPVLVDLMAALMASLKQAPAAKAREANEVAARSPRAPAGTRSRRPKALQGAA